MLDRDVIELAAHALQDRYFFIGGGGKAAVSTLGGDDLPAAAHRRQHGGTKTRARAHNADGGMGVVFYIVQGGFVLSAQVRRRVSEGREIVEHIQCLHVQLVAQAANRKLPIKVGYLYVPVLNWAGDG